MDTHKKLNRLYKAVSVLAFISSSILCGLFTGGSTVKVILSLILPSSGHGLADGLTALFVGGLSGALIGLLFSIGFLIVKKTTDKLFTYSSWAILIAVVNMSFTMFLVHVVGVSW